MFFSRDHAALFKYVHCKSNFEYLFIKLRQELKTEKIVLKNKNLHCIYDISFLYVKLVCILIIQSPYSKISTYPLCIGR